MWKLMLGLWFAVQGLGVAAAPVAVSLSAGLTVQDYQGQAPLNAGQLDDDHTLWVVRERAVGHLQSWYLAFDPAQPRRIAAVLDFGAPIVAVHTTAQDLGAGAATWSVDIDGDGLFDDYATQALMGLEADDVIKWAYGGSRLGLDWRADDPGDHVRVLVWQADPAAVPEPGSVALVLAAGAALAGARRRRCGIIDRDAAARAPGQVLR